MAGGISPDDGGGFIGDEDYQAGFSEDLSTTLDIDRWDGGLDVERLIARIRSRITSATDTEEHVRAAVRGKIFPVLKTQTRVPEAGVYEARADWLKDLFEGLLFPGQVEAVNSVAVSHDSLPIGVTQIGVSVVGYGGTSGTFSQRLFRKEMSARSDDAFNEALECIRKRHERSGTSRRDSLSMLARRGIRAYAERAILLDKAGAEWRIGQGNPCSREMLSGSGYTGLLKASLGVLRRLIQKHKKFVFVPNALEERGYLTLGYALNGGEYAILQTLESDSAYFVERWQYEDGDRDRALAFVRECCPDVLIGLFRASNDAPPYLFYAHREHVHIAAHVALADSILRPQRGFPMLLDVADVSCRGVFGSDSFLGLVQDAYTQAGAKFHYLNGR
ncbi:hypothetical protein F0U61_42610 [Archangium violaceum]|uniref:hypothetical protein n=1 Tax=Archangium violaceum TaxID=83451 RepID=UPI002B2AAE4A|nr:hypothetical protein F0U61_42610 [Archangium violaceum]